MQANQNVCLSIDSFLFIQGMLNQLHGFRHWLCFPSRWRRVGHDACCLVAESRATIENERTIEINQEVARIGTSMGRINVPCDPELLDEYVKALSREHVKFLPPAELEPAMPYTYSSYPRTDRCFILVAEEDSQRAEQIIAEVDRKFYL